VHGADTGAGEHGGDCGGTGGHVDGHSIATLDAVGCEHVGDFVH